MNRNKYSKLLPPLPSLDDLIAASAAHAAPASDRSASTTDAVHNEPPATSRTIESELNIPKLAAEIAAVAGGEAPRADASEDMASYDEAIGGVSEEFLNCFVEAAALRYTFRLDTLTPVPDAPGAHPPLRYQDLLRAARDAVFAYLASRSDIVSSIYGQAFWLLRDDVRREALQRLVNRGMVKEAIEQAWKDVAAASVTEQAAQTPPSSAEESPVDSNRIEQLLWDLLSGRTLSLEQQNHRDLLLCQRVVDWLNQLQLSMEVPSPEIVVYYLARETLIQPFRHLTGEWKDGTFESYFTGRDEERRRLYDYLAVLPPRSLRSHLSRALDALGNSAWRLVSGAERRRPILIYGPGGVGKSTLLAEFLLDHLTETDLRDRFPYAYLDFDLAGLNSEEPLTLLVEAARQLAVQYPSLHDQWNQVHLRWLDSVDPGKGRKSNSKLQQEALHEFASLLKASGTEEPVAAQFARGLPFLLVLDTFEEVQYHSRDAVKDIIRFLNNLRNEIPALRAVMMGRASLSDVRAEYEELETPEVESDMFGSGFATDFNVIEVRLDDLLPKEAEAYLVRNGVSDQQLARDLVETIGGSPLSLRLILRVLQEGEVDLAALRQEMESASIGNQWLRRRKIPLKALRQGILFDRILGHIGNDKIRKLAHPGLVLRRITPELIKDVLTEPCGLGQLNDEQALEYFNGLAREVSLVVERNVEGEKVLWHRPELRQIMLRLMDADPDKQEQIRQVHLRAIDYYEARTQLKDRMEALYHRLMLGRAERPMMLDDVPTEEAVVSGFTPPPDQDSDPRPIWRALVKAIPELPPDAATFLDARLNRELVQDADWLSAHPLDRELMILCRSSRRARERGDLAFTLRALQRDQASMLQPHRLAPESPLPLIEIALLERLGRLAEALDQTEKVIVDKADSGAAQRRTVEYRLLGARLAARLGDRTLAERRLVVAADMIRKARTSKGEPIWDVERSDRQLLRFATDCYQFGPTPSMFETIAQCLLRLATDAVALHDRPRLTRYALASVFSQEYLLAESHPLAQALLNLGHSASVLAALLTDLAPATVARVVPLLALAAAGIRKDEGGEANEVLREYSVGGEVDDVVPQHSARWLKLLSRPSDGELEASLQVLLKQGLVSDNHLRQIYHALKSEPLYQKTSEEVFQEARRAGDLLPGEGLWAPELIAA